MNHQEKIHGAIHKIFPEANITTIEKFSKGLVSNVYKVEIYNPNKILAVKFFPKKIEAKVEKSAKISNYARENRLPTPQTYDIVKCEEDGWVVMDCQPGKVASEVWETAITEEQNLILANAGMVLKRIHDLQIPPFWIHQKHEITSQKEWIEWTNLRIQKYLIAAEKNLNNELVTFLKIKFTRLQELYNTQNNFRIVSLHWDYHLSNVNVGVKGEITGVFDFDNAMKGHDMADIGQTVYWLALEKISETKTYENLFIGYGELSQIDREFVYLHFLLFLAGVMRSTWPKDDLKWLNEQHVEVLTKCLHGEYSFY